jgi:hypothetical protein
VEDSLAVRGLFVEPPGIINYIAKYDAGKAKEVFL